MIKLLFDQNLSPRLIKRLADVYPDSAHVTTAGLDCASDGEVWQYARENEYIIITKDADFSDIGLIRGFPPKIIWLRMGNCTTHQIENTLRQYYETIKTLSNNPSLGILMLY